MRICGTQRSTQEMRINKHKIMGHKNSLKQKRTNKDNLQMSLI